MKIINVYAYQVLNALSLPTVACVVQTDTGAVGKAIVPVSNQKEISFAYNQNEYDNDDRIYNGYSLNNAIQIINHNVNNILTGVDVTDQQKVDKLLKMLSETENKQGLLYTPNMLMVVSLAVLKTAANELHTPVYQYLRENLLQDTKHKYLLPLPHITMLTLCGIKDLNNYSFEINILPICAKNFNQAMQISNAIFYSLRTALKEQKYSLNTNYLGSFVLNTNSLQNGIDLVIQAIKNCGYNPSLNETENAIALSINAKMDKYYDEKSKLYQLPNAISNNSSLVVSNEIMLDAYKQLLQTYPIISIQDPLSVLDFESYFKMLQMYSDTLQLTQDDFYQNNQWSDEKYGYKTICNSISLKLGSIFTVTDFINKALQIKKNNWTLNLQCEMGEVEDNIIADLVVGLGTGQISVGGITRSERVSKYNRIIEIELELMQNGVYKGLDVFYNLKKEAILTIKNGQQTFKEK